MGTPERYLGTALQLVDDKNRVSIPAKFREAVIANTDPAKFKNGPYVLIGKHPQFPCLIAYDIDWLESEIAFAAEGRRASEQGAAYYREIQTLAGGAEPVGFDTTGRCTLQPAQKTKAGITKNAFFYGSIFNFEIWDPQTLLDCADASPTAKDYCRSLMQEKGLS